MVWLTDSYYLFYCSICPKDGTDDEGWYEGMSVPMHNQTFLLGIFGLMAQKTRKFGNAMGPWLTDSNYLF